MTVSKWKIVMLCHVLVGLDLASFPGLGTRLDWTSLQELHDRVQAHGACYVCTAYSNTVNCTNLKLQTTTNAQHSLGTTNLIETADGAEDEL